MHNGTKKSPHAIRSVEIDQLDKIIHAINEFVVPVCKSLTRRKIHGDECHIKLVVQRPDDTQVPRQYMIAYLNLMCTCGCQAACWCTTLSLLAPLPHTSTCSRRARKCVWGSENQVATSVTSCECFCRAYHILCEHAPSECGYIELFSPLRVHANKPLNCVRVIR